MNETEAVEEIENLLLYLNGSKIDYTLNRIIELEKEFNDERFQAKYTELKERCELYKEFDNIMKKEINEKLSNSNNKLFSGDFFVSPTDNYNYGKYKDRNCFN